jgi:hypothetical protein
MDVGEFAGAVARTTEAPSTPVRRSTESAGSVRLRDAMCLLVKPAQIGIAISESAEDEAYSTSQNACKELPECCRSCPG